MRLSMSALATRGPDQVRGVVEAQAPARAELIAHATANPHGEDGFLFYGLLHDASLDVRALERGFYKALDRIGIAEEARIARSLSFHRLRHWSNAMLRG